MASPEIETTFSNIQANYGSCDIDNTNRKKIIYSIKKMNRTHHKNSSRNKDNPMVTMLQTMVHNNYESYIRQKFPERKVAVKVPKKTAGLFSNKLITRSLKQRSTELYIESKTEALLAYCGQDTESVNRLHEKRKKLMSGLKLRPLSLSSSKYPM